MAAFKRLATILHATTVNRTIAPSTLSETPETSLELGSEKVQTDNNCISAYEFYCILRSAEESVNWCEWHLNIDKNGIAIEIALNFHQDFEKLKSSSDIVDEIDTIEETFLKFMPESAEWNAVRNDFVQARKERRPSLIIKAYTKSQGFSSYINKDSTANTYHRLKLYCTSLNCPILARTQEYTEAITNIFFHPKLGKYLVRKKTVYRGTLLDDKKLVANYEEGTTIITTTFLSTSTDSEAAKRWADDPFGNKLSIFCTYNINNTHRHTALDLKKLTRFEDEEEILILRHVPFTIRSVQRTDDGRGMTICFDECEEQCTVEENRF